VNVDAVLSNISGALGLVSSEAVLILAACGIFLGAPFRVPGGRWRLAALAALLLAWWLLPNSATTALSYSGLFKADALSWFIRYVSVGTGILFLLVVWGRLDEQYEAEYLASLLLIVAGLGLTAAANDLIALFLALELVSIPTYVLLYLPEQVRPQRDARTAEAATKYFLLSVFSAAFFLYGLSYLYGTTGSTNLEVIKAAIREALGRTNNPLLVVALVTIVAGLGFRVTAAPFHFYAPDVYEGGPPLAVVMLSVVPKIAGFAALLTLVSGGLLLPTVEGPSPLLGQAAGLCWVVALASMLFGNLLGLWQNNLRRLLAYSGVAHAGYMIIGLGAGSGTGAAVGGAAALAFYVPVYTLMTFGLFAAITLLSTRERPVETVDDLAGLSKSHPFLALVMAVCLFSLTGLPPTVGFLAKLNIFLAAWGSDQHLYRPLALLMAVLAAVGAWYYLRIITVMYLRDAVKPLTVRVSWTGMVAVTICAVSVLWLFISPNRLWQEAVQATHVPTAPLPASK